MSFALGGEDEGLIKMTGLILEMLSLSASGNPV